MQISTASNSSAPDDCPTPTSHGRSRKQQVEAVAAKLSAWRGLHRAGAAFLLGCVSALALPPYYAMPLLWLVYPALLWLLDNTRSRKLDYAIGWCFGFGQFLCGLYWLATSMLVDIGRWWWAIPFGAAGLPLMFAFYVAGATLLLNLIPARGLARLLLFASLFSIAEWLRGHWFTGFPWNLTAQGWIGWLPMLQGFSLIGAYGMGFLTFVAAGALYLFGISSYPAKRAALTCLAGVSILATIGIWGEIHLQHDKGETVDGVNIRLVQPNIAQTAKWSKEYAEQNFTTLLTLSRRPSEGPAPSIIVWPEAAVPWPLDLSAAITHAIASATPPGGLILTGTIRREIQNGLYVYFNSLQAIDAAGDVVGHYDKAHLTPYGEYMPLRGILPVNGIAVSNNDFTPGPAPVVLDFAQAPPFAPLICYEAIFPESILTDHDPQWLLNITNDGWFGKSVGPPQHLAQARARAVEQGLPLLRAANTGISAVVDPYGKILQSLPLQVAGIIDTPLPKPIKRPPYARYGDLCLLMFLVLSFAFIASRRNRP